MKITLVSEETVRFEETPGPLTIEAPSADVVYSPFHMLASAVADCTYFTVKSWATNAKIDAGDLVVEVTIGFAEHPHRVGSVDVKLIWPSLPQERTEAAKRAAAVCPIHQTLLHSPTVVTTVARS
jgi:uncharacterized OsmC-like protein